MAKAKAVKFNKSKVARWTAFVLVGATVATTILGAISPMISQAAEVDYIKSVRVKLEKDDFDEFGFPLLWGETSSDKYIVDDLYRETYHEWEEGEWDEDEEDEYTYTEGDGHKLTDETYVMTLAAADGYKFKGVSKEDINLRNVDATIKKVNTWESSTQLVVEFKLDSPGELVGNMEYDAATVSGGTVYWNPVQLAVNYEIRVSGPNDATIEYLEGTSYDLSPILTRKGEYRVRIYPVATLGKEGDYAEVYITVDDATAQANVNNYNVVDANTAPTYRTFKTGWQGSDGNWTWRNTDGTMPQMQWIQDNGQWYYFGANKILIQNNWVQSKGKWYYMGPSGAMLMNTYTPDGYFVGADGVWIQ